MSQSPSSHTSTRRTFVRNVLTGAAGLALTPRLLRATDLANSRINLAQIGCGRMGTSDMTETMQYTDLCRFVAVCDLDSRRANTAHKTLVKHYVSSGQSNIDIKIYEDYREVLARKDIDAVLVCVPDHWHAQVAIEAALAGKHIYVQKPVTYSVAEAIALRKTVQATKIILQTGSQQRSEWPFKSFRPATEAVRNGRLGKVKTVKIGIGLDAPKGRPAKAMPVPKTFNYEKWLGPVEAMEFDEDRVHPQHGIGRPGWITTEKFGLGMITNWGAHHVDQMLWALGLELSGPKTIEAQANFMKNDVWTVHSNYHVEMTMPTGTQVILDDKFENGLLFEGTEGSIFCSRGHERVTASDPNADTGPDRSLRASKSSLLSALPSDAVRWMPSKNHHLNWLESIKANRDPIAPISQSSRARDTCAASWISMKLGRKLNWDAAAERFVGDDEANSYLSRKARSDEYDINVILKNAGIA